LADRGGGGVRVVMAKQRGGILARRPRVRRLGRMVACAAVVFGLLGPGTAMALHVPRDVALAGYSGRVFEWILLDAESGQVLSEQNADVLTYPVSLTKMMTL